MVDSIIIIVIITVSNTIIISSQLRDKGTEADRHQLTCEQGHIAMW